MIRKAEKKDVDEIVALVMNFYDEGLNKLGLNFEHESIKRLVSVLIDNHIFMVSDNNGIQGIIAGILSNSLYDNKQRILEEKIWFVSKDIRGSGVAIRLFKAFEDEAKKNGVNAIIMTHMVGVMPDNVRKIYESFKYQPMESNYIKLIGG